MGHIMVAGAGNRLVRWGVIMVRRRVLGVVLGLFAVIAVCGGVTVHAIKDATNQGRWGKGVGNGPDKEVPGFLINLGPTGARAVLSEKTLTVKYIFGSSPAEERLKLGDVITGVFNKPFSAHTFGGEPHGYEGPLLEFGEAIERAEAKDGKLVLNIQRGSDTLAVTVNLEAIGAFSPTFPMQCKKSELLRAKALKYLADNPESLNGPPHAKCVAILALLTSGNPQQESIGKRAALAWNSVPGAETWTWGVSYQLITLGEYHLLTGDATVLPTMKALAAMLRQDQYKGEIVVWKAKDNEDPAKIQASQQLYNGGFGHAPYISGVGKNGYGPMQYTTILAVIAWQIAERCGVAAPPEGLTSALEFMHRGTNEAGYVAYGGEFTLNNGYVDPVKWKKSTSGMNYVGRAGASLIAHKMSAEFADSADYLKKNQTYMKRAYKSLPDGHACSMLGFNWGLMGVAASGDDALFRTVFDYHKAWFNLMRCHDGSFVVLPGRDYADEGYYISSRYHPTAIMALAFGLNNPKLQIQGTQVLIANVNSKALKGPLQAAYKAIVSKSYGDAVKALKGAGSEDKAAAAAMEAYLLMQSQRDVAELEFLEKNGDLYRLDAKLTKTRAVFGMLEGFKTKIARFEELVKQDATKATIKLGATYQQAIEALRKNRSATYAGDLERFAERNSGTTYGAWALEAAKEFRSSGQVKDPSALVFTPPVLTPVETAATASATNTPETAGTLAGSAGNATGSSKENTGKEAAGKSAAPRAKITMISGEVLDAWQAKFVLKIEALTRAGTKLRLPISAQESYGVKGANEKALIVNTQGNDLPMPWKQLGWGSRALLAKEAAKDDDVETLLIAAAFFAASNDKAESENLYARAAIKDASAAKEAKEGLYIEK